MSITPPPPPKKEQNKKVHFPETLNHIEKQNFEPHPQKGIGEAYVLNKIQRNPHPSGSR